MNYNYPQPQFQVPAGYAGYRPVQQYPQWTPTATSNSQVRPVSSIEEVKACPIDFDGSVFYFADVANRKIYTKQINLDGTVSINLYELKEFSADQPATSSYVTREEFNSVVNEINELKKIIQQTGNVEQVAAQPQKQPTAQFEF